MRGRKEALGRQSHGHQLSAPPPLIQARPVASKRPDDVSLSLSPSKRVRASPPAQAEGRPAGSGGSQVSSRTVAGSVWLGVRVEAGVTRFCPHSLPRSWSPCISSSATARTTVLRTWRPSSGPAPSSQLGTRVHPWWAGRVRASGSTQNKLSRHGCHLQGGGLGDGEIRRGKEFKNAPAP